MKTVEIELDGYKLEHYKSKIPGRETATMTFVDETEAGIAVIISREEARQIIAALQQFVEY
jgi:hypothetical protein